VPVGQDRAAITFAASKDFRNKRPAFVKIIKQWARQQKA